MGQQRALSDSDAIVWIVERDPALRSTIIGLALLDRVPDFDDLRVRVERTTRLVPKLRQTVQATTPDGGSPVWVTQPDLDLDRHLRRSACPAPGTRSEVLALAEAAVMQAFDPSRPLWEMQLIEGVGDGAVLLIKVHHAITDGMGAFQIAAHLLDLERDPEEQPPLPEAPAGDARPGLALALESASDRLQAAGARWFDVVNGARKSLVGIATDPASITTALSTVPGVARLLAPAGARRSPLFGRPASTSWRLGTLDIGLADLKAAGRAVDCTLNDAFLGVVSGALQRYHDHQGAPVEALRITMPVSVRRGDDDEAGNRFTPVRFDLPVGIADPAERLRTLDDLAKARRSDPALALTDTLAAVLNGLPAPVVTSIFGTMLKGVDLVASNVPGSPVPLFLAGAEVTRLYPFAPPTGAALSITLVSHNGICCIGVEVDPANVTDPELFMSCLRAAADEVVALGKAEGTRR